MESLLFSQSFGHISAKFVSKPKWLAVGLGTLPFHPKCVADTAYSPGLRWTNPRHQKGLLETWPKPTGIYQNVINWLSRAAHKSFQWKGTGRGLSDYKRDELRNTSRQPLRIPRGIPRNSRVRSSFCAISLLQAEQGTCPQRSERKYRPLRPAKLAAPSSKAPTSKTQNGFLLGNWKCLDSIHWKFPEFHITTVPSQQMGHYLSKEPRASWVEYDS